MKIRSIIFDILVGVPGGFLIFMGMLMFNTLLSLIFKTSPITMLIILSCTSLVVGMLARLIRPIHGVGTAIAAGIIAALLCVGSIVAVGPPFPAREPRSTLLTL